MTVYLNNIHDTDPFLNLRPSSSGAVNQPNLVLPPTCGKNVNTQRSVAAGPSEVSAVETERDRARHEGWGGMSVKPHYRVFISKVSVAESGGKENNSPDGEPFVP